MRSLSKIFNVTKNRYGQGALGVILTIAAIVSFVGITLAFLASSFITTVFLYDASLRARALALSAAEDASLLLVRRALPEDTSTSTISNSQYNWSISRTLGTERGTIIGQGAVLNPLVRRQFTINSSVDNFTGQVIEVNLRESTY